MDREFDIVIVGVTGFTGRLVLEHALRTYDCSQSGGALRAGALGAVRVGIAGRSKTKIENLYNEMVQKYGKGALPASSIILCDSTNESECKALARRCVCVATTVGPYLLYGEGLVAACAQMGTHYCDITGEVPFIARMEEKYGRTARESGAKIVHSCGFDSIPSDLGTFLLQHYAKSKYGVPCHRVDLRLTDMRGSASGGTLATFMNLVDGGHMANAGPFYLCNQAIKLTGGDKELGEATRVQQPKIGMATHDADRSRWVTHWIMAGCNGNVVRYTNHLLKLPYGKYFAYSEALDMGYSRLGAFFTGLATRVVLAALYFKVTRPLAKMFLPAQGQGPSPEAMAKGHFTAKLYGVVNDPNNNNKPAYLTAVFESKNGDPGYSETAKMIFEAAKTLALQPQSCNNAAGILTPAAAMAQPLSENLRKLGMTIKIES